MIAPNCERREEEDDLSVGLAILRQLRRGGHDLWWDVEHGEYEGGNRRDVDLAECVEGSETSWACNPPGASGNSQAVHGYPGETIRDGGVKEMLMHVENFAVVNISYSFVISNRCMMRAMRGMKLCLDLLGVTIR